MTFRAVGHPQVGDQVRHKGRIYEVRDVAFHPPGDKYDITIFRPGDQNILTMSALELFQYYDSEILVKPEPEEDVDLTKELGLTPTSETDTAVLLLEAKKRAYVARNNPNREQSGRDQDGDWVVPVVSDDAT